MAQPCSWKTISASRSSPLAWIPTPCHPGRKRPRTSTGTGSTSRRSAARDFLRRELSTSGWQSPRPACPGRNSPATISPRPASRRRACSTSRSGSRQRPAGSALKKGTCVRAQANGQGNTQRFAIAGAVLGGDPARLVGDAHAGGAAFPLQLVEPFATNPAGLCLSGRQVAKPAQEVGGLIDVARPAFLQEPLQLQLERLDGAGVEKLAKFLGAEQLGQQLLVERQRLRPPLRQWRVALVHVLPDVVENQGRPEGRS